MLEERMRVRTTVRMRAWYDSSRLSHV
jgi:hypothetical protein